MGGVGGAHPSDCKSETSDRLRLSFRLCKLAICLAKPEKGRAPVVSEGFRQKSFPYTIRWPYVKGERIYPRTFGIKANHGNGFCHFRDCLSLAGQLLQFPWAYWCTSQSSYGRGRPASWRSHHKQPCPPRSFWGQALHRERRGRSWVQER